MDGEAEAKYVGTNFGVGSHALDIMCTVVLNRLFLDLRLYSSDWCCLFNASEQGFYYLFQCFICQPYPHP